MRKEAILWSCVALMIFGSMSRAEDQRAYIGVSLDSMALPDLLTKHLRLEPGQGVRINNIMTNGPADKAGLERDDIIVAIEGEKVTSREQFVNAVRQAGAGAKVALEVIHLGQHKTVQPKLEAVPDPKPNPVPWKYPPELDAVTAWRPLKLFQLGRDGRDMLEIPFDKIPDINSEVKKFLQESYTYHHATDGEDYTITIEGNPADKDSRIVVDTGKEKHTTTVGAIEALPERFRGPAQEAVEHARANVKMDVHVRGLELPEVLGPEARRKFFESIPRPDMERLSEQKDFALGKIQEQMERLQQRVKDLEERNREIFDKLLPKNETKKSQKPESQTPTPSESQQKQAI